MHGRNSAHAQGTRDSLAARGLGGAVAAGSADLGPARPGLRRRRPSFGRFSVGHRRLTTCLDLAGHGGVTARHLPLDHRLEVGRRGGLLGCPGTLGGRGAFGRLGPFGDLGSVRGLGPLRGLGSLGRAGGDRLNVRSRRAIGRGGAVRGLRPLGRFGALRGLRGLLRTRHFGRLRTFGSIDAVGPVCRRLVARGAGSRVRHRLSGQLGACGGAQLGRLGLERRDLGRADRLLRGSRRQQPERIDVVVIGPGHAHPEMKVRRLDRPLAAHADRADPLARGNLVAALHDDLREMEVRRVEPPVGRPDRDRLPGRAERPGVPDRSGGGRTDRVADLAGDVDPPVLSGGVGIVAVAVGREHLSVDRPRPVARSLGGGGQGEGQARDERGHDGAATARASQRGARIAARRSESSDRGRGRIARTPRFGCGVGIHGGESTPPTSLYKGAVAKASEPDAKA